MLVWKWGEGYEISGVKTINLKAALAEFIAMTLFVIIGCGTACANGADNPSTRLVVALAFGLGIMCLAYTVGKHSGGQINCAVTFSLVLACKLPWWQGLINFVAQMLGSVAGALALCLIFPCADDMTTTLGTNIMNSEYGALNILLAETFGTFLLCFVVFETAVSPLKSAGPNACIAIGFAVFLAHVMLLPLDGCSINPTRSFGPAIVSAMRRCENYTEGGLDDLVVFWAGPLIGAALAAGVQRLFAPTDDVPILGLDLPYPEGVSSKVVPGVIGSASPEDVEVKWGDAVPASNSARRLCCPMFAS